MSTRDSQDEALQPFLQHPHIEVDHEPLSQPADSEVRQNLRIVYWQDVRDRFHLDDELVLDDEVSQKRAGESNAVVGQRNDGLFKRTGRRPSSIRARDTVSRPIRTVPVPAHDGLLLRSR